MRSTEFITEAPARTDDFGQPINQPPTDAEYAARQAAGQKNLDALKGFGSKIAGAFKGTGTQAATPAATQPGVLVDRDGNPVRDGSGQPIRTPNSPVAASAAPQAALPAAASAAAADAGRKPVTDTGVGNTPLSSEADRLQKLAGVVPADSRISKLPPAAAAAPAVPPPAAAAAPAVPPPAAAAAPAVPPAAAAAAPAVPPAPAPVQNADPVPSLRVPGAAQAGQGGTNYTTGVAQDRPHRPDAGADQTTRNDYPFEPYTGPEPKPKPNVKPVQNPQPVPKPQIGGKFSKGTPLPGPDGRTPVPALAYKTVGPEFKPYPQQAKTLPTGNSATPAAAATGGYPDRITDPKGYDDEINRRLRKKFGGGDQPAANNATPVPAAAGSVVIKPGDTLSRIAAANGTTVPAIMAANPSIRDPNKIAAGQTVKLRESSDLARIRHLAGLSRN